MKSRNDLNLSTQEISHTILPSSFFCFFICISIIIEKKLTYISESKATPLFMMMAYTSKCIKDYWWLILSIEISTCPPTMFWRFLTHLPLVPHICVNGWGHHWSRYWLVACSAPSHYINQCWFIVNWTPENKFQWNVNQDSIIFIQENAFENAVCQNGGHFVQGEMS